MLTCLRPAWESLFNDDSRFYYLSQQLVLVADSKAELLYDTSLIKWMDDDSWLGRALIEGRRCRTALVASSRRTPDTDDQVAE